ncbi:MAG: hypothetical protein M0Q42_02585 [Xanthomonadales bacterium]|nr:hypothetical protein [Xanthomonadales bacterium]
MLNRLLLSLLCLFLAASAQAASFSSLEERMSDSEFRASGLDRLSQQELAQLNQWLRQQWPDGLPSAAAPSSQPGSAAQDTRGLSSPGEASGPIVSRIEGTFTGWRTGTVFRLENGMVWETVGSIHPFSVSAMENPSVTISTAFMGSWLLKVDGFNTPVRVRRVR